MGRRGAGAGGGGGGGGGGGPARGLEGWLEGAGGRLGGGLRLGAGSSAGGGLAAVVGAPGGLRAGEVAVAVPGRLCLTAANSVASRALRLRGLEGPAPGEAGGSGPASPAEAGEGGPVQDDAGGGDSGSPRLAREALVIALMAELARGEASPFFPYLRALPGYGDAGLSQPDGGGPLAHLRQPAAPAPGSGRGLHCPCLWTPEQLELLKGTDALRQMLQPSTDATEVPCMTAEHWAYVAEPFFEEHPELGVPTGQEGQQLHRYATAVVASYSFSLYDAERQALVPFWDMLNHAPPGKKAVRLNNAVPPGAHEREAGELQMIATEDVAQGGEVWNSYGSLSNSELLRRYGFVLPQNKHDCVFLHVSGKRLARLAQRIMFPPPRTLEAARRRLKSTRLRLGVLRRAGLLRGGNAKTAFRVMGSGRPSAALLETLRVLSIPDREFYESVLFFLRTNTPPMPGPSSARQGAFVEIVLKWLARERLEPLVCDSQRRLDAAKGDPGSAFNGHRRDLAVAVVRSEAECLEALRRRSSRPFAPLEPELVHRAWRGFWGGGRRRS